jgi:hypothetical protein
MSMSRPVSGLIIALVTLSLFPLVAAAQLAVSANDGKVVLVNGVVTVPANPLDDTVTIINIGVSPPKVIAEIKAPLWGRHKTWLSRRMNPLRLSPPL